MLDCGELCDTVSAARSKVKATTMTPQDIVLSILSRVLDRTSQRRTSAMLKSESLFGAVSKGVSIYIFYIYTHIL